MTKMTVHYDDASQQVLSSRPEASLQLYQVKHDYEIGGDLRDNLPEVYRLNPQHYVVMTEEVQTFMFRLLMMEMGKVGATLDQMKAAWVYLYKGDKAFTNKRGVDTCRDYINGTNLSGELPGLSTLVCGGNVLAGQEVMAKWDNSIEPCLQVSTIDVNLSLPSPFMRSQIPHWISFATNSTLKKLSNGTYQVTRFSAPKMMGSDAPVPLLSNVPVVYPLRFLKKLPIGGLIPTPYNY